MSPHDSSRDAQSISMGGEMSVCGGSAGLPNESTLYSAWYSESSEKGNFYQQIYHVFDVMIIKPSCESPAVHPVRRRGTDVYSRPDISFMRA